MGYIVKATSVSRADVSLCKRTGHRSVFSSVGKALVFSTVAEAQGGLAAWIEWQKGNPGYNNFRVEEASDDRDRLDEIPEGHLVEDITGHRFVVVRPEDGLDRDAVPVVNMVGILLYLDGDFLFKDLGHIDPTSITTDKE